MAWRLAKSLEVLRTQVNALAPKRSKLSDGGIGNAAHASRASDHNPWVKDGSMGVVTAFDFTHDPNGGFDAYKFAETLKANSDPRIKYVISNRRIWNPSVNMAWRKYNGVNPHNKHTHISVKSDKVHYDGTGLWYLVAATTFPVPVVVPRILKKGNKGQDVRDLQTQLKRLGYYPGVVDGDFGPATLKSVQAAQVALGLKNDGMVGPDTLEALKAAPTPTVGATKGYSKPENAVKLYQELGWSKEAAVALVANLLWESGGNTMKPPLILFGAHGDKGKDGKFHSHGAGQWNDKYGRYAELLRYALERGTAWDDGETQLRYLDHELKSTEKKAGADLMAAKTLEAAVTAAIKIWRPGIPHADRRLAIARTLYG